MNIREEKILGKGCGKKMIMLRHNAMELPVAIKCLSQGIKNVTSKKKCF